MTGVMSGEQAGAPNGQFMTVRQVVALAEQHQQAGRVADAENLCRQVLQSFPKNAPALHLLGIIAHHSGKTAVGVQLLQQAVAARNDVALYHSNLGEMLRASGRVKEAITAGQRAIELD